MNEPRDRRLLTWLGPEREPMASVVYGRRFHIGPEGVCDDLDDFVLQAQPRYEQLADRPQHALLVRDTDLIPWRQHTDLVVRGVARSARPVTQLFVTLACRGAVSFELALKVSGDRWLERHHGRVRMSESEPFDEMPLRYDRAYGGTDERARARRPEPAREALLGTILGRGQPCPVAKYSYPRNPCGRGYVVDCDSIDATPCPNLEFVDQQLDASHFEGELGPWGTRPYPATFDWFAHGWFPRIGFTGLMPRRGQPSMPDAEVALGLMPPQPMRTRLSPGRLAWFGQGAHPYLWRHRLSGVEHIRVDALGRDGQPLLVQLPGLHPHMSLRIAGQARQQRPAGLDLVLIEAEEQRLTLVWRASFAIMARPPIDWQSTATFEVSA